MNLQQAFDKMVADIAQGAEFPDVLDTYASQVTGMDYGDACDALTAQYDNGFERDWDRTGGKSWLYDLI